MSRDDLDVDVLRELLAEGNAVGRLAEDEKAFRAAYEAFRREDPKAFREVLERFDLLPRCALVCEWIRSKECVLRCTELAGPPKALDHSPSERALAEGIARITSEPKTLHELARAFEEHDAASLKRIAASHQLEPLTHFLCHWLCIVRTRLVCRWLCAPHPQNRPSFVDELAMAGRTLHRLLDHRDAFQELIEASRAGDSERMASVIRQVDLWPYCYLICLFFCSWRCVLACFTLCRSFPAHAIKDPVHEAFEFAQATRELVRDATGLERLSGAVGSGDAKAFATQIESLRLQRFCFQVCHWICTRRCWFFCRIICPPIYDHPWFTHVGDFGISSDINPGTGLTNAAQGGHGGPSYGFFNNLSLRGFCPKRDPAHPSEPMAYRFLFEAAGIAPTPINAGFVSEVLVGSRYTLWNGNNNTLQTVRIRGGGATSPTPPTPGPGTTPPDHFIVPDGNGWVTVDERALDNAFSGALMGFASAVAFPGGAPNPGISAGTAVPAGSQRNGADVRIIFQATRVSTIPAVNAGGPPDYWNDLPKTRINNWEAVHLLDLLQFTAPGSGPCSPLTNSLDILYTTDHELLASWSLDLVTSAAIVPAPVFPGGIAPRGAAGTDTHNVAAWPSCSYMVQLHTRRSLTDGLIDDPDVWVFKTFCIGRKQP